MRAESSVEVAFEFGPFRLLPRRRLLTKDGVPVSLGSRAMDLLQALTEEAGELLSRSALEARAWPGLCVEETSLRVHMSALRRTLREGRAEASCYIRNEPGRGYRFVAPVRRVEAGAAQAPEPPPRPIGRADVIDQLERLLDAQRLLSIVGPGGVGKTTVAQALAQRLRLRVAGGVHVVDLARLGNPAQLARALEGPLHAGGSSALIVVDNCEHLVEALAPRVDALLRSHPGLRVLSTGRECLALESEWVFRLPPLALPPRDQALAPAQLLGYPAVQLFVERARAICADFEFDAVQAPAVRALCEALDGNPLAIELAAARVGSLGAPALSERLDDLLDLLTGGRRTARESHHSLNAVLDASCSLLSPRERQTLLRLSVLRGAFDLDDAVAAADPGGGSRQHVVDDVLALCSKSLLDVQGGERGVARFRLPFVTRLYAERRLSPTGEAPSRAAAEDHCNLRSDR